MTTPERLILFIDYQNAYRRARSVFFPNPQSGRDGHLKPMELGRLIANRVVRTAGPTLSLRCEFIQGDRTRKWPCAPSLLIKSKARDGGCPELQ